jgi:hypothetical protein
LDFGFSRNWISNWFFWIWIRLIINQSTSGTKLTAARLLYNRINALIMEYGIYLNGSTSTMKGENNYDGSVE